MFYKPLRGKTSDVWSTPTSDVEERSGVIHSFL